MLSGSGGGSGGRGGEHVGNGAYRTSLFVLPQPPLPPPVSSPPLVLLGRSPSSQRTPTPSPSMDGTGCLFWGWLLLQLEAGRARTHPPPDSLSPPVLCRIVICNTQDTSVRLLTEISVYYGHECLVACDNANVGSGFVRNG